MQATKPSFRLIIFNFRSRIKITLFSLNIRMLCSAAKHLKSITFFKNIFMPINQSTTTLGVMEIIQPTYSIVNLYSIFGKNISGLYWKTTLHRHSLHSVFRTRYRYYVITEITYKQQYIVFITPNWQPFSIFYAAQHAVNKSTWWFLCLECEACNYFPADCNYGSSPALQTSY